MIAVLVLAFVVTGSVYGKALPPQLEISNINDESSNAPLARNARQLGKFQNIFIPIE